MAANSALRPDTAIATPLDSPRAPCLATVSGLIIVLQSEVMLIPIVALAVVLPRARPRARG